MTCVFFFLFLGGRQGLEKNKRKTTNRVGVEEGLVISTHLVEHAVKLIPGLRDTVTIVAIHHEDQTLGVLEVVPPERADLEKRRKGEGKKGRPREKMSVFWFGQNVCGGGGRKIGSASGVWGRGSHTAVCVREGRE